MILCRQNKHVFVLFTLENIPVSPRALRPLARDYKYSTGGPKLVQSVQGHRGVHVRERRKGQAWYIPGTVDESQWRDRENHRRFGTQPGGRGEHRQPIGHVAAQVRREEGDRIAV